MEAFSAPKPITLAPRQYANFIERRINLMVFSRFATICSAVSGMLKIHPLAGSPVRADFSPSTSDKTTGQ